MPSDWKTQIKNNKEVVIGCFVPQYVSTVKDKHSGEYIKYRHTIAMPQAIVARHGETPDQFIKRLDGLFKVKGSDSIRKMQVQTRINEGYTTSTAEVEISKELQALIDDGLFDIEQVKSDVVVRGQRTRELVIVRPVAIKNDDTGEVVAFVDDEYEYSVLQVPKPKVESDSDFNTIKTKDKDVSVDDIEFNDEFSTEDDDNFLDGLFD